MRLHVVILGDPVPKGRPRTDTRGRRPRTYTPARTEAAEQAVAWELRRAHTGAPTTEPVTLRLVFYCATRRRCDIDNLAKLVLDAGNGIVWVDDQQIAHLDVSVLRGVENPRTYVLVTTGLDA